MAHFLNIKVFSKLIIASSISIFSLGYAYAEATLQVDDNIKVMAINGKAVNKSLFQPIKKSFRLAPGQHVITARYDRMYELRGDEHDYLKSDNITLTTTMQDNQTYRLTMPGQPEKYKEARKFAKQPTLAVQKGSQILVQESTMDDDNGLFAGITKILVGEGAQEQNKQTIAAIRGNSGNATSTSTSTISAVSTPNVSNAAPVVRNNNATTLDRFMEIWLQATPDEREKIRQWVQQ